MSEERRNMESASSTVLTTLYVATLLAIGVGSLIAVLLSRKIAFDLRTLLVGVQRVAAGDLTAVALPVNSQDEIGDLAVGFNQMVRSLRGILAEITTMTAEVATASSQIATAAQQQVASLNQTAASLNEITTTAEEFKATMQEFADRARAVQEAAEETTKRPQEGRELSQDSADRINQVRNECPGGGRKRAAPDRADAADRRDHRRRSMRLPSRPSCWR